MLKLTIPTRARPVRRPGGDPRVLRVLALSGGYSRDEACALLARDPTMIASFSRALAGGAVRRADRRAVQRQLDSSIEQIFQASVVKEAHTT